ncbi:HK97-gp10 family putative phage morphogenesis protein [Jeotgalibacillus aurantiacus]|uniref:HK97-gp10 family putative phage morphogenesis protein n=1 Tax=Jeotgalibacillus aurantiacus TaxID=2763266 RepID=UPI001D0A87FE|nr:HK97-gp10 family putative phage morphogenesis protein [Jeotgalibacillus aurantiacus]
MQVKFEGIDRLSQKLDEMKILGEVEGSALNKSADHLKSKLQDNVYRMGLSRRTGKAEGSVLISEIQDGKIFIGFSNQQNDAFYMFFHEWGTSKMRARPVLRPTFYQELQTLNRILKEELQKGMGL